MSSNEPLCLHKLQQKEEQCTILIPSPSSSSSALLLLSAHTLLVFCSSLEDVHRVLDQSGQVSEVDQYIVSTTHD